MEEMTRERLEAYISCKAEIVELKDIIDHLAESEDMLGNDVINDYQTGYPRPQSVVGFDCARYERRKAQYQKRKSELESECAKIEAFIEVIPDSLTRRIFRMYFIQGMSQVDVAKKVHLDRSVISRKINDYLKVAHKTQKTHL